ncbi:probable galacturonosyltransferase 7 isoform X1 [Ipomoea triloba]|uniref:probable galacturonosyltransferase 7 isoform X1 n=1 Tax=Ipomoea triloba TaxID=35885 RepID=UPI00125D4FA0|nr:probable galacturonosyltransferase 7 isoform X1 [Ipomoea triloba]
MKGGGQPYAIPPGKRRWNFLVIAVLCLVFLSMLVPLIFLLGLHNGFHSSPGYVTEKQTSFTKVVNVYDQPEATISRNKSEGEQSSHIDDVIRRLEPTFPKDFQKNIVKEAENKTTIGPPRPDAMPKEHPKENSNKVHSKAAAAEKVKDTEESIKLCELKYGSYCLWRQQNREKVNDFIVRKMKDLLYVARAYYPSIAKLPTQDKLSLEMKQNIQDFERVLSETTVDKDLPSMIGSKLGKMEAVIAKAKACPVECGNVDKKFRQLVDLTEDEANFHAKQSAFLYQLAVQTMPKSLHCLSMRLTVEYFRSSPLNEEQSVAERYLNPDLHHYIIFSKNVLASSAVVNSTVLHAKESEIQVFHVLTDRENYFAMKLWFFLNKYKEATVQVLNIEDPNLDGDVKETPTQLLLPEEYRIFLHKVDKSSTIKRTEYLSVFTHSHYLLPKIFRSLKKVVVLDDDIIVQRDLSDLWRINLDGKVNGAVQVCSVRLVELKNFLGDKISDEKSCAWMSGLNIIDLDRWRERDLSGKFQGLLQGQLRTEEGSSLRATLLTFQDEIYGLDYKWVLSGLGHEYGLDTELVKNAGVLHFNGNMKPWLDMGIRDYKEFWSKYLNKENQLLRDCNVN